MDVIELYNDKNLKLNIFLFFIIVTMDFIGAFQLKQRTVILFTCDFFSCRFLFLFSEQSRYGTTAPLLLTVSYFFQKVYIL